MADDMNALPLRPAAMDPITSRTASSWLLNIGHADPKSRTDAPPISANWILTRRLQNKEAESSSSEMPAEGRTFDPATITIREYALQALRDAWPSAVKQNDLTRRFEIDTGRKVVPGASRPCSGD
jgi:hypothetical protein